MRHIPAFFGFILAVSACTPHEAPTTFDIDIDYEEFTLDNGLTVLMHVDRSSPSVTVRMSTHVGSAREKPGRTGFAHLFEHLLFLESENLGRGGLDEMSERIGGTGANGSTGRDDTRYDQTVPSDALEKMIWAEADRLGYFINTVTEPVLEKEKQVVKNEKRERYDNRAYGHKDTIVQSHLYPDGHPYSWPVIGSLADLEAASLDDVKEFYRRWYVPNNVVLSIAGDFDVEQALEWVHKYFDDIERGPAIEPLVAEPVVLPETRRLVFEDPFANTPELTLVWPAPPQFHEDSYALSMLIDYLGRGKDAPLNAVVVDGRKTSPRVRAGYSRWELAGEISIAAKPLPGMDLNDVYDAVAEALAEFERSGMPEAALRRLKARSEVRFYDLLLSPGAKSLFLGKYALFTRDTGFYATDIRRRQAVTVEDVVRVFNTYIKDRPHIALSMVPAQSAAAALHDSEKVDVPIEQVVMGAEQAIDLPGEVEYDRSRSSFDRSVEPPYGDTPRIRTPDVWRDRLDNGLVVLGTERGEVPLVKFQLLLDGGMWFEDPDKAGVANLLAESLTRGTQKRTTAELEAAIRDLGSSISVRAGRGRLVISGTTLSRHYDDTIELLKEILLEPRFDEEELAIARDRTIANLRSWATMPSFVTRELLREVTLGDAHPLARNSVGTPESVAAITSTDLRGYYSTYIKPNLARFHVAGAVTRQQVLASLDSLNEDWPAADVAIPDFLVPGADAEPVVYFYDIPGAKQSSIRVGQIGIPDRHPDFQKLRVVNYRLGGAGFMSMLMQQLRDERGYAYSAGSSFSGNRHYGTFTVSTNVRTNATADSLSLIRDILEAYPDTLTGEELQKTRNALSRDALLQGSGLSSLLHHLARMSEYDLPPDFRQRDLEMIANLDIVELRTLARRYIDTDRLFYLVVGDAATQLDAVRAFALGRVELLNDS